MFTMIESSSAFSSKNAGQAMTTATTVAVAANAAAYKDTSCVQLSRKALAYFGSERFSKTLKSLEDSRLAKEYGKLIASRKREAINANKWQMAEAIVWSDLYDLIYDGQMWDYESLRDMCKGYRSQALREAKEAKGFNISVYRAVAELLNDKREIRALLKSMNSQVILERSRIL